MDMHLSDTAVRPDLAHELERLDALHRLDLLDTPP